MGGVKKPTALISSDAVGFCPWSVARYVKAGRHVRSPESAIEEFIKSRTVEPIRARRATLPSFGRKWRGTRAAVGLPDDFRFHGLRHTGHTLSTRSGATLKDTVVRAGQSSEKAALIYQHSDEERQRDMAAGRAPQGEARRQLATPLWCGCGAQPAHWAR